MSDDPTRPNGAREEAQRVGTDNVGRGAETAKHHQAPPKNLQVRCAHCHSPVEIVDRDSLADIACPSCGSHFSLVGSQATTAYLGSAAKTLGHFTLLEEVGGGRFGSVWKARDTELDRIVAVKIPRQGQLDAAEAEQFLREARAAAQVRHPNIVSVHEVGREHESVYIVSDFVEGASLQEWLTGQRLTPREAAQLCAKIADALHEAHEAGVVHRDLKPGNIMLNVAGEPYLTDFGLARRERGDITMTLDGRILGTPAYMSPEQARGEGHRADRRSDVYSLGVILFELLTSELPFRGDTRMLIVQILRDEPQSPRKLDHRVPRDLEVICLKCLEKDPSRRYSTARDLADDLRRYLAGESIRARSLGRPARAWRWCKRNPVVAGLAATAILLLAAVAAVTMVGYVETSRALELAEQREVMARSAQLDAEGAAGREREALAAEAKQRRVAETTLVDMYTSFGLVAGEQSRPQEAVIWFAQAAELARNDAARQRANRVRFQSWSREFPVPVRAFMQPGRIGSLVFDRSGLHLMAQAEPGAGTIWDLDHERPLDLPADAGTTAVAWARAGDRLAVGSAKGEVKILALPAGKPVQQVAHAGPICATAFSPDGRYLGIAGQGVRVWDCQSQRFITPDLPHPKPVMRIVFDRAGTRVATACLDGRSRVFAVPGAGAEAKPLFDPIPNYSPRFRIVQPGFFSPLFVDQDRGLLTLTAENELGWWDAEKGKRLRSVVCSTGHIQHASLSPSGRALAVCGFGSVELWRIPEGNLLGQLGGHTNRVHTAAFSPDGQSLLTGSIDRTLRLWSLRSSELLAVLHHQDEVIAAACSPDGRFFATAQIDGLVRLWALPRPPEARRVPIGASDQKAVVSADGRLVMPVGWALSRMRADTRVYELATGQPAGPALEAEGLINGGDFSPDGRLVAIACSLPEQRKQQSWQDVRWERYPGRIEVWDWRTGKKTLAALQTPSEPIDAAYSPDGKVLVAVCAAGEVLAIDAATGSILRRLRHEGRAAAGANATRWIRFAPGGKQFVTLGLGPKIHVWNMDAGRLHAVLEHVGGSRDASFSRDGRWLATASDDKQLRVWDTQTWQLAVPPLLHPDWVFSARFSPDAQHVLTACRDHMARLWDWRNQRLVCPALEHKDEVFGAAFTPDGRWIVTVGRDGTTRVWEGQTGKPVTPSWPLSGPKGWEIFVAPDQGCVGVVGETPCLDVFDLKDLAEADRPRVDSANLKILGEVLSGRSVYGGGTANLTSAEWLSRWEAFRHSYPEYHDLAQFRTMSSDAVRAAKPADVPAGVPVDRYVVALGHLSAGQFNEAIAALDQHLASRPNHCCGYYHRGAAYLALGRYEEAVADLTKAIELKHKGSDVRYGRGVAYSQLGQFDKSLDDLNQVIQMTPGHSIAYQHRAGVYAELGQWEKAAADFAKTVELGRYEEVFASYALVRLQWKGMSEYRAFCRELLERLGQTKDADTANGIAWTCCLVPEAVADFRPCVRLAGLAVASEPKSRVYVNTLGAALYRAGDFQGAVEKMTEAVQLAGPEVSALDLFFLAMAHHRLKRQDQARQFLAKAVQWIDDHGGANSRPGPRAKGLRWTTRLEIQLLRKEAESLIGIP